MLLFRALTNSKIEAYPVQLSLCGEIYYGHNTYLEVWGNGCEIKGGLGTCTHRSLCEPGAFSSPLHAKHASSGHVVAGHKVDQLDLSLQWNLIFHWGHWPRRSVSLDMFPDPRNTSDHQCFKVQIGYSNGRLIINIVITSSQPWVHDEVTSPSSNFTENSHLQCSWRDC